MSTRHMVWFAALLVLLVIAFGAAGYVQSRISINRVNKERHADDTETRRLAADVAKKLLDAQIRSCERVNLLRVQFNTRGQAVNDYAHAEIALQTAVLGDPHASAREKVSARVRIVQLSKIAEAFGEIALVNCEKTIRNDG